MPSITEQEQRIPLSVATVASSAAPLAASRTLMRLDGVGKTYLADEVETHALRGISLEVHAGDYLAVSGPSGCGKSTLLSLLGLLDAPTSGTMSIEGTPVGRLTPEERARLRNRHIGFIFQAFHLIGDLTVRENVELPLQYRGMGTAERRAASAHALERVGLGHRAGHYPGQLSGGQQQRAAVARAVAGAPTILLADEPTGNLDSESGAAVMDILRSLHASGTTICMVTHDPRYVGHATRIVHLFDGQIVRDASATRPADKHAAGESRAS